MKLFDGIKIWGMVLMVAIAIGFFGCGEDEEVVKPVNPVEKNPVTLNPQEGKADTPGPAARIVWIKLADSSREELKDFEDCDQIKHQDTLIVRVLDTDGKPVPDARVEWTLNTWPDEVGDIIETDDPGHKDIPEVQAAPQLKVDNQFAITFTNNEDSVPPQLKGMSKNGKDIVIRKGETWITMTSTHEGDTDVTAFAPAIPRDGEQPHKIFGVKHWIDLDWIFPQYKENAINYCAGGVNEDTFVTKLIKFSDSTEVVPGVKVRYSILPSGPDAVWKETSGKIVEVISDKNGEAKATIKLTTPNVGESKILVEILTVALKRHGDIHEPGEVSGDCLIKKEITRKWLGPSLKLTKIGPDSICLLGNASYSITVTNDGDAIATSITVTDTFDPKAFDFVAADNSGTNVGGAVNWNIGNLKPGDSKTVGATLKGINTGNWQNTAETESKECVKAKAVASTTIVPPALAIAKACTPIVGLLDEAVSEITVKNTSTCPTTNIVITDLIDASAFKFVNASDGGTYANGKVTWPPVSSLAAGDSKTVSVKLQALKISPPGLPWKNMAEGQSTERALLGLTPVTVDCATAVVVPELRVVCEFNSESIQLGIPVRFGEVVTKAIQITNVSKVAASLAGRNIPEARGIGVVDSYPANLLTFTKASDSGVNNGTQVIWSNLGKLGPGESKTITVDFKAQNRAGDGIDRVSVTSQEGPTAETECPINICEFAMELIKTDDPYDPVAVGQEMIYVITVKNQGDCTVSQVILEDKLPQVDIAGHPVTMNIVSVVSVVPNRNYQISGDKQTLKVEINTMAPKEVIEIKVKVKAEKIDPGVVSSRVENVAVLYVAGKQFAKHEQSTTITQ